MDPKRWEQIDKLLDEALERGPAQRAAFLAEACGGDEELCKAVEELIAAHEQAGSFGERPAVEVAARLMTEEPGRLLVGKRLGPYEIISPIGRGGMGEVYRARDTRLDRIDALKVLPVEVASDPERIRRFVREAKAASALNHPNIATIYEIGESEGIHWISMELVEGETLAQRLNEKVLGTTEILDIGIQVCEALEKAHGKGIVHRDIKPANIMLTPEGQVKVLDFGLAKITRREGQAATATVSTESHTIPGMVMGTARYMSPEQVLGQAVDHRTDVFSLGAVLYEMATGQPPFAGETASAIFDAIVHEKPAWPSKLQATIPEELRRVILKSLEKFREMRHQSASYLCADLRRLREGIGGPATRVGVAAANAPRGKHWKWIAGGIVVLSLVLAGILWYANRRAGQPPVEVLNAVPLTTYPGVEDEPTLSPDGSQVAFTWAGESEENTDIWVKVIGAEPPLRLTSNPARDFSPAWSPDGRWIAFCRDLPGEKTVLILIPPIGGQERILAENLSHRVAVRSPFLAWMPDSRSLVIAANENLEEDLFLLSIETHEMRKLTTGAEDSLPAVSPDGTRLAFCRWTSWANSDLYLMELSGKLGQRSELRRLTFEYANAVWSAWSADSRALIFSVRKAGVEANLFRVDLSGTGRPQRLAAPARFCSNPVVSRQGNRLVYVQRTDESDIWRMEIPSPHEKAKPPTKFISTSRSNVAPRFAPDGKSLAFTSDRSGTRQIWVCNSDGSNPVQITSLGKGYFGWFLPWSPDSRRLTFYGHVEGRREVYVINADGRTPQRLTTTPSEYTMGSANASWSRDGRWILFDRAGEQGPEICRISAQGGTAVPLIKNGWSPIESPDGRFIYYFKGDPNVATGLWRVPKEGGEAQQVLDNINDNENYDFVGNEIYFIPKPDAASKYSIECLDTTTGKIRQIATFDHRIYTLTVSPDRRWILWCRGEFESDLMLVEDFR